MQAKLVSFFQSPIFGVQPPAVVCSKPQRLPAHNSGSASAEPKNSNDAPPKSGVYAMKETAKVARGSGSDADKPLQILPIPTKSLLPSPLNFLWFNQDKKGVNSDGVKGSEEREKPGQQVSRTKPTSQPGEKNARAVRLVPEVDTGEIDSPASFLGDPSKANRPPPNPAEWREEDLIDLEKVSGDPKVVHGIENSVAQDVCAVAAESLKEIQTCDRCVDCTSCSADYDSDPGSPRTLNEKNFIGISHTADTFKKYLKHAHLEELRTASLMSVLSDLAYTIKGINSDELFRKYGLVMITSSISQKKMQITETAKKNHNSKRGAKVESKTVAVEKKESNPNYAYSFASAAISYIQSQSLSILPIKSNGSSLNSGGAKSEKPMEKQSSMNIQETLSIQSEEVFTSKSFMENPMDDIPVVQFQPEPISPISLNPSLVSSEVRVSSQTEEPALVNSPELHPSERSKEDVRNQAESVNLSSPSVEGKGEGAVETPSACDLVDTSISLAAQGNVKPENGGVCPCEWFVCDDAVSRTRYFVIQGSDSIASWQTNISFDPVVFESPDLRVMVHRGIYDAAKTLYTTLLPLVKSHMCKFGSSARIAFTGHSLGGSLSTLLMLMLRIRLDAPLEMFKPVYTFGSPSIMCGGDRLLDRLGFSRMHVRQVMMHRDLVPRAFACDYPDHVADVLRRINGSFRDHPCLQHQKLMYAHMGTSLILQPEKEQAPFHHLLPSKSGLFYLQHPLFFSEFPKSQSIMDSEVRSALRSLLNSPHPLEILADPGAYGTDGSISKYHNPANYCTALHDIFRSQLRKARRIHRSRRRDEWGAIHFGHSGSSGEIQFPLSDDPVNVGTKDAASLPASSLPVSYGELRKGDLGKRRRRSGSLLPRAFSTDDLPSFSPYPSSHLSVLNSNSIGRWSNFVASRHMSLLMFLSSYSYLYSADSGLGFDCNLFS